MEKLPARTGWSWVREGFALFRKQPGALLTMFLGYALFMLTMGTVPILGQVLTSVLVPVFSVAFMQACLQIERKQSVFPTLLLTGFRQPVVKPLLQLGAVYFLMVLLAIGASALVDGGTFWQVVTGQINPKSADLKGMEMDSAMLLAAGLYMLFSLALCFSAPLILWKKMPAGKAIFFSVWSVLRLAKAFLIFVLAWFAISTIISQVIGIVFGRSQALVMVMIPLLMVMWVVVHCSFYASYRQVFGLPEAEPGSPVKA